MVRGPDRRALHRWPRSGGNLGRLPETGHVFDRHLDAQLERFLAAGVEHAHGSRHPIVEAAQEPRDLVEGTLCRREADALDLRRATASQLLEALEAEREVRSAFGGDDRVDLV